MALSNWDTLSVDFDGNLIGGNITSPNTGITVSIYKNWLTVYDPRAWREEIKTGNSAMAFIQHGELSYGDINIFAVRGPQSGVYCVVYISSYNKKICEYDYSGMIGIGCYGFDANDWVGVKKSSILHLQHILENESPETIYFPDKIKALNLSTSLRFNQGDKYFADNLGINLPMSTAEKSENPIIIQKEEARTPAIKERDCSSH